MSLEDALFGPPPSPRRLPVVQPGNRISSLPVTKFCGASARISELSGSGRAALMSTWFHAYCADPGGAATETAWRLLTEDEQEECAQWSKPTDVETAGGVTLTYAEAEKELEVRLRFQDGPDDIESVGHLDMAWKPMRIDGLEVVHVGDIKRQRWTTADGPDSLQLHGYGWAYAKQTGAQAYVTGIWLASEGEWRWSSDPVVLETAYACEIREELIHAMRKRDDFAPDGVHCRSCYGRIKCPEYALGALRGESWLAELGVDEDGNVPNIGGLNDDTLKRMLLAAKNMQDIGEAVVKQINALVERGRFLHDEETGKVYARVPCRGRESVCSAKELREKLGPMAEQYISRGAGFFQKRWINR